MKLNVQLRERDRRALFLLAGALLVYIVLDMIAFPAWDRVKGGSDAAKEKEVQLQKYRRALVRKGHYAKLIEQAKKNLADAESRLIRGDNPSLAAVELQNIVESAATKTGVGFTQRNISTARKKDDFFNEITMTLSFDCTPNQLAGLLAEMRSAPKFISIRNAQVTPIQTAQEPPKTGEFAKTLRVNLTLAALLGSAPSASSMPPGKG